MTVRAEAALAQIASRLADYRQLASIDADTAQRVLRRFDQPRQTRHGNALVDLVAVAESYTSARLLDHHPGVKPDEVSTWEKRRKAWKKHGST